MNASASQQSNPAQTDTGATAYDAIVVGASAAGLSVALQLQLASAGRVLVLEAAHHAPLGNLAAAHGLEVAFNEVVERVAVGTSGTLQLATNRQTYTPAEIIVAIPAGLAGFAMDPPGLGADRVHEDLVPQLTDGDDVLVVGADDWAVELAAQAAAAGANVVLAAGGLDPANLSEVASIALNELAVDPRVTVLYRSHPKHVTDTDGFPLVTFGDQRTPDLQFDHVVYASSRGIVGDLPDFVTTEAATSGRVRLATPADMNATAIAPDLSEASVPAPSIRRRARVPGALDELRELHYNATITAFDRAHDDLWIIRVRPDDGGLVYRAGQYASLGLGYWEERTDGAVDPDVDERWDKLIRRSYSISSRIFDQQGYLVDDTRSGELEFYIVLVSPSADHVPGLTPRLALKQPGDRVFLGTKAAGRYNVGHVTDPESTVLLLATGTGEAPHNAMAVELLQRGHRGPIVSAVSVRKWADLAYRDKHQLLDRFHDNYHYLPLPTREPDTPKRYLQEIISNDTIQAEYGIALDPATTHVFLCGNPRMIGLPENHDGHETFSATVGVVQLLTERGFVLDRPGTPGNIHFEEYW